MRSTIAGTGHYLPARILTNAELARTVDTSDEWIRTRTGIRQRHIAADDETTSDLATHAAREAIAAAGLSPADIDLIIVATATPDMIFPSTASIVQDKLGIRNGGAAFDVAAVCSGFVYGLAIADKMVATGAARNALVIGAEIYSRILDWHDRATCVLFGDGAGAVVLLPSDTPGILSAHLHADDTPPATAGDESIRARVMCVHRALPVFASSACTMRSRPPSTTVPSTTAADE